MPPKHLLQAMLGACKALQMHSDRRCKVLMYDMFGHLAATLVPRAFPLKNGWET